MKISLLRQTKEASNGVLDLANFDVQSSAAPLTDNSFANKAYVDSIAAGLDPKGSVRVATTANIDLATGGLLTIDGVTVAAGDRVLVKDQTDPIENGIYNAVDGGAWTRAEDQDGSPAEEVSAGNYTFVESGTLNAATGWSLGGSGLITIDTDALNWIQFNSQASYNAGFGLDLAGTTFSVDASDFADGTRGITSFDDGGNDKLALDAADVAGSGLAVGGSAWQLAVQAAPSTVGNAAAVVNVGANGVSVDVDLATIGEVGGQLVVLDEGITEAKLDILDTPGDGEVLTWNNGAGRMEWQGVDALVTDPNNKLIQFTFQRVAPGAGQINVGSAKDLSTALGAATALTGSDILVYSNGVLLENGGDPGYTFSTGTPSVTLVDALDGNPGQRYFDDGDIISIVLLAK